MQTTELRRRTRRKLTVYTVIGAALTIFYIIIKGDPESQLHRDALEYSYFLIFGVLTAYGGMAGWDRKIENDASRSRSDG
jgi:hypothetical protein